MQHLSTWVAHENLLSNLLVVWSANRNNARGAKLKRMTSSAGADFASIECVSATPDDKDICEVEWDSPRPLSGNNTWFTHILLNKMCAYTFYIMDICTCFTTVFGNFVWFIRAAISAPGAWCPAHLVLMLVLFHCLMCYGQINDWLIDTHVYTELCTDNYHVNVCTS